MTVCAKMETLIQSSITGVIMEVSRMVIYGEHDEQLLKFHSISYLYFMIAVVHFYT